MMGVDRLCIPCGAPGPVAPHNPLRVPRLIAHMEALNGHPSGTLQTPGYFHLHPSGDPGWFDRFNVRAYYDAISPEERVQFGGAWVFSVVWFAGIDEPYGGAVELYLSCDRSMVRYTNCEGGPREGNGREFEEPVGAPERDRVVWAYLKRLQGIADGEIRGAHEEAADV